MNILALIIIGTIVLAIIAILIWFFFFRTKTEGTDEPDEPEDTTVPVFRYSFSDSTVLPAILDQTVANNDAAAEGGATLSVDVPFSRTGFGNRSLDTSSGGLKTSAINLLDNSLITANGGFTYECWFKWNGGGGGNKWGGSGGLNAVIDYAGTEKLRVASDGKITIHIGDIVKEQFTVDIGTAVPGQWHYTAVVFDSEGAALDGNNSQTGKITTYLDSSTPSESTTVTLVDYGDTLARPTSIGMHPTNNAEYFDGLIFEPRVTLGPVTPNNLLFNQGI